MQPPSASAAASAGPPALEPRSNSEPRSEQRPHADESRPRETTTAPAPRRRRSAIVRAAESVRHRLDQLSHNARALRLDVEERTYALEQNIFTNLPQDPVESKLFTLNYWTRKGLDPSRFALTRFERCVTWCALWLVGIPIGLLLFGLYFPVLVEEPVFQPTCERAPGSGLVCNGFACNNIGACVCPPQWSGTACEQSACAVLGGFNPKNNTACYGYGQCSPFMQYSDVPEVCGWTTPTEFNPNPTNYGWYHPLCDAYLQTQLPLWQSARNNITILQQNPQLAGVPICVCTVGSRDGPACEYEGCPLGLNGQICSGFGNTSVGLFGNGTASPENTGCQAEYVENLMNPVTQKNLSTFALTVVQGDLPVYSNPIAGRVVAWNNSMEIAKGALVNGFPTSFKCFCDAMHTGPVCFQGTCPTDSNGNVCGNHGLANVGYGYVPNTTSPPFGADCSPICAPGNTACFGGTQCGPNTTPELFLAASWCSVTNVETPPTALTGAIWRCASGALVRTPQRNMCATGFTSGTLDPAAYGALRTQFRLDTTTSQGFATLSTAITGGDASFYPQNTTLLASAMGLTYQSPVSWFLFVVRNAGSKTARVEVSVGNTSVTPVTQTVAPGTRTLVFGAPQMSVVDLENAEFAPPPVPALLTARQLTSSIVQLYPAPFLDTLPAIWSTIRLQAVADGTLLAVQVQGYNGEFASGPIATGDAWTFVALAQPQNAFLGTAGIQFQGNIPATTCLDQISQCGWSVGNGSLTGEAISGGWVARLNNATGIWYAAQPGSPGITWAAAPTASWTALRGVVTGYNLLPLSASTASNTGLSSNAWSVQLPVLTAQWTLWVNTTQPVYVDAVEIVPASMLEQPCTCDPRVLHQTPNRTTQDAQWLTQPARFGTPLSVGDYVALQFSQWGPPSQPGVGFPQIARGIVELANTLTAQVQVQVAGYGLVTASTAQTAQITQAEFRSGADFSNPWVFPARCPTGYRTPTAVFAQVNNETGGVCDVVYPDPVALGNGQWWEANCTFPSGTACACSSQTSTTTSACSCVDASGVVVDDEAFAAAVWALADATQTGCVCTSVNGTSPLPSDSGGDETHSVTVSAPTFSTGPLGDRALLGVVITGACALPTAVTAYYGWFSASWPVAFSAACASDNSSTQISLTFNATLPYPPTITVVGLPANITTMTAVVTPGGTPLLDLAPPGTIAYTASMNSASAGNVATAFATQPWVSGPAFAGERSVWLRASFTPTIISRALLTVSSCALPFANGLGDVPVQLGVDVLVAGASSWTRIATLTCDASASRGAQSFVVDQLPTQPIAAMGVTSRFAMSVLAFVPLVDQWCSCTGAAMNVDAQLVGGFPVLNTQSALSSALEFEKSINPNCTVPPVCADTCQYARDGECQDTVYWAYDNGLVWTQITTTQPYITLNNAELLHQPSATAYSASESFAPNATLWLLWTAAQPAPVSSTFTEYFLLFFNQTDVTNLFVGPGNYTAIFTAPGGTDVLALPLTTYNGTTWVVSQAVTQSGGLNPVTGALVAPPTGGCAAGTDCTDCGCTCRVLPVDAGLQCNPTPFETLVLDMHYSGAFPSDARLLQEYLNAGATATLMMPTFQREVVVWASGCAEQVCSPFQERCADGACRDTCVGTTSYTCAGNGCVASAANAQYFYCVCEKGWNGDACQYNTAVPVNVFNPKFDFYTDIRSYAPPGLMIQPAESTFQAYAEPPPLEMVRVDNDKLNPNAGIPGCVAWSNIMPKYVGGYPYPRKCVTPSGLTITTDAPPAIAGPYGQVLYLDDCVQTRDPSTNCVTSWVTFPAPGGASVQIIWTDVITCYTVTTNADGSVVQTAPRICDDFCVRCTNGDVAGDVQLCASDPFLPCNGHGTPLSDGSCDCSPPWTTWMYQSEWTAYVSTPYVDPQIWNQPYDGRWRVARAAQCLFKNCNQTSCTAPRACFPGTPSLNFADALTYCGALAQSAGWLKNTNPLAVPMQNFAGQCAASASACQLGATQQDLECSGHGVAYIVAYTNPVQWGCACGDPISATLNLTDPITLESLELSELQKSGWGGDQCGEYYCSVPLSSTYTFSQYDPLNFNAPYTDLGIPILGKWLGPCGTTLTASPTQAQEWQQCCGTETRLLRCTLQPCTIAGNTQCVDPRQCVPLGGTPLVYVASNNGRALADGTVECTTDATSGTGFFDSPANYSVANCFGVIACPVVGTPCNQQSATDTSTWLGDPTSLFFSSQPEQIMWKLGLGVTNQTMLTLAIPTLLYAQQTLVDATSWVASATLLASAQLKTCVNIVFGDNPADPVAMLPYDPSVIGGGNASYNWPYEFTDASWFVAANSSVTPAQFPLNYNFTVFPPSWSQLVVLGQASNVSLLAEFPSARTLYFVRVWCAALTYDATHVPGTPVQLVVTATDEPLGVAPVVCPAVSVVGITASESEFAGMTPDGNATQTGWGWTTLTCVQQYTPLNWNSQPLFQQNCGSPGSAAYASTVCAAFMESVCAATPNAIWLGFLTQDVLQGCPAPNCCLPLGNFDAGLVSSVYVRAVGGTIAVQTARIMGYTNESLESPPAFVATLAARSGANASLPGCWHRGDYLYTATTMGVNDQTTFLPGDPTYYQQYGQLVQNGAPVDPLCYPQTQVNWFQAAELCNAWSAWLAAPTTDSTSENPNIPGMAAPLLAGDTLCPSRALVNQGFVAAHNVAARDSQLCDVLLPECTGQGNLVGACFYASMLYFGAGTTSNPQLNATGASAPEFVATANLLDWNSALGLGVWKALGATGTSKTNAALGLTWAEYFVQVLGVAPLNEYYALFTEFPAYATVTSTTSNAGQIVPQYHTYTVTCVPPECPLQPAPTSSPIFQNLPLLNQQATPNLDYTDISGFVGNALQPGYTVWNTLSNFDFGVGDWQDDPNSVMQNSVPVGPPTNPDTKTWTTPQCSAAFISYFGTTDCTLKSIIDSGVTTGFSYVQARICPENVDPDQDVFTNAYMFGNSIPQMQTWSPIAFPFSYVMDDQASNPVKSFMISSKQTFVMLYNSDGSYAYNALPEYLARGVSTNVNITIYGSTPSGTVTYRASVIVTTNPDGSPNYDFSAYPSQNIRTTPDGEYCFTVPNLVPPVYSPTQTPTAGPTYSWCATESACTAIVRTCYDAVETPSCYVEGAGCVINYAYAACGTKVTPEQISNDLGSVCENAGGGGPNPNWPYIEEQIGAWLFSFVAEFNPTHSPTFPQPYFPPTSPNLPQSSGLINIVGGDGWSAGRQGRVAGNVAPPVQISYVFRFDVTQAWRSIEIQNGIDAVGGEATGVDPLLTTGRSHTNGWYSEPYTPQSLDIFVARAIEPGGTLVTYTRGSGTQHPLTQPANWFVPSLPIRSGDGGATLTETNVPPCEICQVNNNALFQWDSHDFPNGGNFPGVQNAPGQAYLPQGSIAFNNCTQVSYDSCPVCYTETCLTTDASVSCPAANYLVSPRPLTIMYDQSVSLPAPPGLIGKFPNDGLVPLNELGTVVPGSAPTAVVTALYKMYAYNNVALTTSGANTQWTYMDCVAIVGSGTDPTTGATLTGLLVPYSCALGIALNYLCTFDWTKYTTRNGHNGYWCGDSTRVTGAAQVGTTCFQQFPQGDPAQNEAGFAAVEAVQTGTVWSFVGTPIAWDVLRQYLDGVNATWVFNIPGVRTWWEAGYSTQPGATTPGLTPDPYSWVNFDWSQIWPVDCGPQTSQATGLTARWLAVGLGYCSPNAPQRPEQVLTPGAIAQALYGIPLSTPDSAARFMGPCGIVVSVAQFVAQDTYGGAMPEFSLYFQIPVSQPGGGLAIAPLTSTFSVFNSGKNPRMMVFQEGTQTWFSGTVQVTAPAGSVFQPNVFITIWIGVMNLTYGYPPIRQNVGTIQVPVNAAGGATPYQFSAVVNDAGTYQVVGFDVVNATAISTTVFLSDVVVSTADTIMTCRTLSAKMPKYGAQTQTQSLAPNNLCPMTQADLRTCGECTLGQCFCDVSQCGPACVAPCLSTNYGKHSSLVGSPGLVTAPTGSVEQTSLVDWNDDMRGVYSFVDAASTTWWAVKVFDVGVALYTRMMGLTSSPQVFVRYDSLCGEEGCNTNPYVVITGLQSGPFNALAEVESQANAQDGILPSFVDPDSAAEYLSTWLQVYAPVFVAFSEHADGNWYADSQGLPVGTNLTAVQIPLPIVCEVPGTTTNFPAYRCAAINAYNLAFNASGTADTDGTFSSTSISSPTLGQYTYHAPPSVVVYQLKGAGVLAVWYDAASSTMSPQVSAPCSSQVGTATLVNGGAEYLAVYTCGSGSTVPVTYSTGGNTAVVLELMLFENANAAAAAMAPFYPFI